MAASEIAMKSFKDMISSIERLRMLTWFIHSARNTIMFLLASAEVGLWHKA
jgi:hypothetical protein